MHNDIMAISPRERPPMLAMGRYAQWQSHFLRYVDIKPNKKELRQFIFDTKEMWTAIKRLQQGELLNKQDVKTNLFWEFGKFTSRDGESIKSYYSRFYKMMNEMIRNKLEVDTMQVNVQFLQQLQPEWSRFVTVVKQTSDLDTISYHKLFEILKQYQNEVNDIRDEKIAMNANPLALVAATQQNLDNHYQAPKLHKSYAPSSKQTPSTRSHAPTRNKSKEIAKPNKPPSKNKKVATSLRTRNNSQTGQFGNQRTVTVVGARETVGNQEEKGVPFNVEQGDWLDDTDEESGEHELEAHYMYMANIQEVLTTDSGPTFDAEPLEHVQSNDDYNMFATKRQQSEQPKTINDTYVVETVKSNVILNSSDMCDAEEKVDQNAEEYEDERVVLANLIANLKLDHDENKKSKKQLKKANATLTHELNECKSALDQMTFETDAKVHFVTKKLSLRTQQKLQSDEALKTQAYETFQFKEKNAELVHQSSLEHTRYELLRKEKEHSKKDFKISQDKDIEKLIALENQVKFLNDIVYKTNQSVQTIHMLAPNSSSSYNVIIKQRVKVNQKARILELKRRDYEDHYSNNLYAVSMKEDTAYLCLKLHLTSMKEDLYAVSRRKPYVVLDCKSWNILEYNNRGAHAKKPQYTILNSFNTVNKYAISSLMDTVYWLSEH
ncbi:hypothetical protein Tco_0265027 [Tanacetum coccineum]